MAPSATIEDGPAAAAKTAKTTEKEMVMSPCRAISHGDELPGWSFSLIPR